MDQHIDFRRELGPGPHHPVRHLGAGVDHLLRRVDEDEGAAHHARAVLAGLPPPKARHVFTRRSSNPSDFYSIVGIDGIDDDGRIHFSDGGEGQIYLVVGSASYLLFDEDRIGILDRVDSFWRKVDTTCEHSFITTKEPQRIYHQVANLERRNQALQVRDPDLVELQNEQYDILARHVGGQFTSIHQYLLLKGKSADALRRGHLVLQAEVEGSSLMVKEVTMLDREEAESMLRVFYQGIDDELPDLKVPLS